MLAQENSADWTSTYVLFGLVGLVLLVAGILIVQLAKRLAEGRIGPNGIAGIRTEATRSSPEAWLLAHQAGRRSTAIAGWILIATGPISIAIGLIGGGDSPDRAMLLNGISLIAGTTFLLVFVLDGARRGNRAAIQYRDANGR